MRRALLLVTAGWLFAANAAAAGLSGRGFTPGLYAHIEFGAPAPAASAPAFSLAHVNEAPPELALRATSWPIRTIAAPAATGAGGAAESNSSTTGWIIAGVLVVGAAVVIIASSHHGGGGGNGY